MSPISGMLLRCFSLTFGRNSFVPFAALLTQSLVFLLNLFLPRLPGATSTSLQTDRAVDNV